MQKNINEENVKGYLKKVNKYIYIKNYKVRSNRNVNKETNKRNKEKIYKNNKYIEMCIKISKNIYNIEMYVEKYSCKNIKEYMKNRKCKNMYNV